MSEVLSHEVEPSEELVYAVEEVFGEQYLTADNRVELGDLACVVAGIDTDWDNSEGTADKYPRNTPESTSMETITSLD